MKAIIIAIAMLFTTPVFCMAENALDALEEFNRIQRAFATPQRNYQDNATSQNQREIVNLLRGIKYQIEMDNLGMSLRPEYDGR